MGGLASGGPGRFRAPAGGGSARRTTPRSRYVDTFNTGGDGGGADAADNSAMPPPPARAKPAPPAYKVFTPQKAAGGDDAGAGGSTPLFMTPTAEVYANTAQPEAEAASDAPTAGGG